MMPTFFQTNDEFLDIVNDQNNFNLLQECKDIQYFDDDLQNHGLMNHSQQQDQWMLGANEFEIQCENFHNRPNSFQENNQSQLDSNLEETLQKKLKVFDEEPIQDYHEGKNKSIYLKKITTLIQRGSFDSNQPIKSPTRVSEKINRKSPNGKQQSESSNEQNELQLKMEKNRNSARSSRQRKKVYIELMEIKIEELKKQVTNLEMVTQDQKAQIDLCQYHHKQVQQNHLSMDETQKTISELSYALQHNQPFEVILDTFEINVAQSATKCEQQLRTLVNNLLPLSSRQFCEAAEKSIGIFDSSDLLKPLSNLKAKLSESYDVYKRSLQKFQKQFKVLGGYLLQIESILKQISMVVGRLPYAQQIIAMRIPEPIHPL